MVAHKLIAIQQSVQQQLARLPINLQIAIPRKEFEKNGDSFINLLSIKAAVDQDSVNLYFNNEFAERLSAMPQLDRTEREYVSKLVISYAERIFIQQVAQSYGLEQYLQVASSFDQGLLVNDLPNESAISDEDTSYNVILGAGLHYVVHSRELRAQYAVQVQILSMFRGYLDEISNYFKAKQADAVKVEISEMRHSAEGSFMANEMAAGMALDRLSHMDIPTEDKEYVYQRIFQMQAAASSVQTMLYELPGLKHRVELATEVPVDRYIRFRILSQIALRLEQSRVKLNIVVEDISSSMTMLIPPNSFITHFVNNVLTNVLDQSSKIVAQGRQPEFTFHAYCLDNKIVLSFQDNGMGIPRENLRKASQGRRSSTKDKKRGGYGLVSMIRFVRQSGGTIAFDVPTTKDPESQAVGTTIKVMYPVTEHFLDVSGLGVNIHDVERRELYEELESSGAITFENKILYSNALDRQLKVIYMRQGTWLVNEADELKVKKLVSQNTSILNKYGFCIYRLDNQRVAYAVQLQDGILVAWGDFVADFCFDDLRTIHTRYSRIMDRLFEAQILSESQTNATYITKYWEQIPIIDRLTKPLEELIEMIKVGATFIFLKSPGVDPDLEKRFYSGYTQPVCLRFPEDVIDKVGNTQVTADILVEGRLITQRNFSQATMHAGIELPIMDLSIPGRSNEVRILLTSSQLDAKNVWVPAASLDEKEDILFKVDDPLVSVSVKLFTRQLEALAFPQEGLAPKDYEWYMRYYIKPRSGSAGAIGNIPSTSCTRDGYLFALDPEQDRQLQLMMQVIKDDGCDEPNVYYKFFGVPRQSWSLLTGTLYQHSADNLDFNSENKHG